MSPVPLDEPPRLRWIVPGRPDADAPGAAEALGTGPEALAGLTRPRRPSLSVEDGTVRLTLRTLDYDDDTDAVETGQLDLLVRGHVVVAAHTRPEEGVVRPVPHLAEDGLQVLTEWCRWVVAGYEDVCAELFVDIEEVEESVFSDDPASDTERIYTLKREVAEVRRAVTPLHAPLEQLGQQEAFPEADLVGALRELEERLHRLQESVDTLDAQLASVFDAHVARISIQQNEDMRRISAAAALVVVPTLIAGIYGMNFTHMPELEWRFGYPLVLAVMGLVTGSLYAAFRRSGWL